MQGRIVVLKQGYINEGFTDTAEQEWEPIRKLDVKSTS